MLEEFKHLNDEEFLDMVYPTMRKVAILKEG